LHVAYPVARVLDICRLILEDAGLSKAGLVQPTQRRLYEAIGEHPPT
jgi:hypothetical protein